MSVEKNVEADTARQSNHPGDVFIWMQLPSIAKEDGDRRIGLIPQQGVPVVSGVLEMFQLRIFVEDDLPLVDFQFLVEDIRVATSLRMLRFSQENLWLWHGVNIRKLI